MVEAVAMVAVAALVLALLAILAGAFWMLRLVLRNAHEQQTDLLDRVQAPEAAAYSSMSNRAQSTPGMSEVPQAPTMDQIDMSWLQNPESAVPFDDDLEGPPPPPASVAGTTPVEPDWARE